MSNSSTYLEFSEEEAAVGVNYAKERYHVEVSIELLRDLANRTRGLMEREIRAFTDARYQVLNGAKIFAKTPAQAERRDAYKGALGKMFSRRKQFAKMNKSPRPTMAPNVSENQNGQFEFILG